MNSFFCFFFQFFCTSPLACDLKDLPAIHTEDDEPTRQKDKKHVKIQL